MSASDGRRAALIFTLGVHRGSWSIEVGVLLDGHRAARHPPAREQVGLAYGWGCMERLTRCRLHIRWGCMVCQLRWEGVVAIAA